MLKSLWLFSASKTGHPIRCFETMKSMIDVFFPKEKAMRLRGYFFIICAAALWGLIGPVSRFALAAGISAIEIGFFRAAFAWLFFASHAIVRGKTKVDPKDLPLMAVFGLVGISVFYTANFIAVDKGGSAFAAVLLYTAPAWVAILSPLIFKETMTLKKIGAVVLTITGIGCICFWGNGSGTERLSFNVIAVITGLVSGLAYSMYYIFGKYFSSRYTAYTLFMYILPVGALGLLPFISFSDKTAGVWAILMFLAFFCTYLANSFYYAGLNHLEPTKAVLTATIEPVIAAFFAWLIWNEMFTLAGIGGAVIILIGVLLTIYEDAGGDGK